MRTIARFSLVLMICLPAFGFSQTTHPTSYDSDGDGIPDSTDACAFEKGTAQFHGCPYEKHVTAEDRDGDGVKDAEDKCPDFFGVASNKGCPDLLKNRASNGEEGIKEKSATLFTTTTGTVEAEQNAFKAKLMEAVKASGNNFTNIKLSSDSLDKEIFTTMVCPPDAYACYINEGKNKYFFAGYGTFSSMDNAYSKYNELKQKLLVALGETEWKFTDDITDGVMEKYKAVKIEASNGFSPIVTAYLRKMGNEYHIYLMVENKADNASSAYGPPTAK